MKLPKYWQYFPNPTKKMNKTGKVFRVKNPAECEIFDNLLGATFIKYHAENDYLIFDENMNRIGKCYDCLKDDDIIPCTNLDCIMVGDVLESTDMRRTVIGRAGRVIFTICNLLGEKTGVCSYTVAQLKASGYHLANQPEETVKEMTLKEVCEKLGENIKIIKE